MDEITKPRQLSVLKMEDFRKHGENYTEEAIVAGGGKGHGKNFRWNILSENARRVRLKQVSPLKKEYLKGAW